jgi:hypothetical protein
VRNVAKLCKLQKVIGIVAVVFSMTGVAVHAQSFTTLVNFNFTDGYDPIGELVQGTDGSLYGTTTEGGNSDSGWKSETGNLLLATVLNFDYA